MPRLSRFTIRAASALTGINPNTLRAWERRYGLVRPERTAKGYRLYSDEDLRTLRLIHRALHHGISVGRIKDQLGNLEAIEALTDDTAAMSAAPGSAGRVVEVDLADAGLTGSTTIRLPARGRHAPGGHSPADFAAQIEQAAIHLDRTRLDRAFGRAVGLYSLRHAFHHALAPALRRVGERYLRNPGSIAEEHFLTAFARERLLAALAGLRPLHQPPRVLFACAPGEHHEIMLMLLALEVGLEGVHSLYLGQDVPIEALFHAAQTSGVRVIVVSCTIALPRERLLEVQRRLSALTRPPRLLAGGPAAERESEWLEANGIGVLSLSFEAAARQVVQAMSRAPAA
jgi:DNA-binding transcriptional MerR regulator/methanogenic corrinoid protein MtbC1